MNNIWVPVYKILSDTTFLDITSFNYDLDSIKLILIDDNNKEISVEANEIINFSYTNEQVLYLNEFNFTSDVDRKDFPHHFFYKVTNSTLIKQFVHDSANLLNANDLEHFLIRLSDGLFNIVCRNDNFEIRDINWYVW